MSLNRHSRQNLLSQSSSSMGVCRPIQIGSTTVLYKELDSQSGYRPTTRRWRHKSPNERWSGEAVTCTAPIHLGFVAVMPHA
jgi:hypothetical protein